MFETLKRKITAPAEKAASYAAIALLVALIALAVVIFRAR